MTTPGFNTGGQNISSQFGMPLYGIAGMLPFTGNFFWVDETNGNDGNTGGPGDPLRTLSAAYGKCVSGNSDVVFITGSIHVTATVAWAKNKTHLIGLSPPSQNSRARIAISGSSPVTPLVNVTGQGCIFQNIEGYNGVADASAQVTWKEAGGSNYYKNCNFIQTGSSTATAQAGNRALVIDTQGENLFEDCTIGGDTNQRITNANATLELTGGSPRNAFKRCLFQAWNGLAGNVHIKIASGGADRYVSLEQCQFLNFGTAMDVAITNAGGSPGSNVVLNNCISVGATKIATAGVYVNQISAAGGGTTYLGVAAS